jgi:prepilin-type N-terminal cleavage/methylation domain-containing protein
MKQKGFTLIELLVVIAITAVLGTLTMAGFDNYNQIQVLQTSSNDVITMLNEAKSRAQSQVKLGLDCSQSTQTLDDYRVEISTVSDDDSGSHNYKLFVDCEDSNNPANKSSDILDTKNLPKNIHFTTSSSFSFPVLSGGVEGSSGPGPWTITILSSNGKTKTITVSALGGISTQ